MTSLRNKTLVVTGASKGIGANLAKELAHDGVNLVLGARTESGLEKTRDTCRSYGVQAESLAGDASTAAVAKKLVKTAYDLGNFHGFVQAAGIFKPGPLVWDITEDHLHEVMNASVGAAHQLIRYAVPILLRKGEGLAIFFGSDGAEQAQPGIGAYYAAKAAEEHLAHQLAVEAPSITTLIWRPYVMQSMDPTDSGDTELLKNVFTA
ncbi:SDR family NAD(P)-dependent oxidoreductase [Pseudodesulfovibrio sp. JC047]|uniref:SDR family NAD(P)-dependent oxidoreductase n=1 Tax=Pseudodesulfovibrio sp. JC047 TaxID=2683199 RepID=UPI0013D4826B|nr:SDR family oxidoreductase [Pseudodesulfovibrio sp. JC047]NDV19681.1 SDR family NAD(P)-dependent oxidoreductase [Pseudodesulfovibrio sp. JC047]